MSLLMRSSCFTSENTKGGREGWSFGAKVLLYQNRQYKVYQKTKSLVFFSDTRNRPATLSVLFKHCCASLDWLKHKAETQGINLEL